MATKQIEEIKVSEDDKEIIYKVITKVISDDGREDIYIDTRVESKSTNDSYQTEHESIHSSGMHNIDYIGSESTTHVHERPDGSTITFDKDNDGGKTI